MLAKVKTWSKDAMYVVGIAAVVLIVGSLVLPGALRAIDRHRFAGLWHVDGTMENWRFGSDGTFLNESLMSIEGTYSLLPGGRIDISTSGLGSIRYVYSFDGVGLILTREGEQSGYRLVRKD